MNRREVLEQLIKQAETEPSADNQAADADSYADKFLDALLNNIKIEGLED